MRIGQNFRILNGRAEKFDRKEKVEKVKQGSRRIERSQWQAGTTEKWKGSRRTERISVFYEAQVKSQSRRGGGNGSRRVERRMRVP